MLRELVEEAGSDVVLEEDLLLVVLHILLDPSLAQVRGVDVLEDEVEEIVDVFGTGDLGVV